MYILVVSSKQSTSVLSCGWDLKSEYSSYFRKKGDKPVLFGLLVLIGVLIVNERADRSVI